ncbi:DNA-binding response regulator, OmpR family, contains REC and winged-helix (wHTH) domain [Tessaracoccus bendigoensis DSM 12906]|uniref:DNA-binding response regulator, OmpR family, contains REC and winged-helix (WHTH) domain n=1 Tax=Tessaracoccus bendigoensis DSM 12906 TaxID=1123357 RepID=A0A1M6LY93_9ACTN|nr:response regulator transcription factor [Tessaracoccus bendigoensis]SHJ76120.1 DNA-binding response regulator, OmpR family, contains REC and winged-helix (wHTH) domain [Tessaracoccus bendigoensis DSM 12906]
MSAILIVEDETRIASFIAKGLRAAGFSPRTSASGREAVSLVVQGEFDLVVLDVGLPDIDGFEVLEQIRGQGVTVPVIMLTARSSIEDRVAGLEGGADDYMPKPFSFEELLARIRLRLRPEPTAGAVGAGTQLSHNGLVLDLRTRRAQVDGAWIDLSAREFALTETFLRNPGQVLSREQLLSSVWGLDFDPGSNIVDVYVRYLRGKLGRERFETVRGMGYRLL